MKTAHKKVKLIVRSSLFLAVGALSFAALTHTTKSANLTSVSVTLSNARPSFRGALGAGNTVGSSIATIDTDAGDYPSTSSAQLVEGDVLAIGDGATLNSYTVATTSGEANINLTAALVSGDTDAGDDVISTISATHTVRFTTASAVTDGTFQILVPALTDDGASSDGIPDGGFFDYGDTAPTVTCPSNLTGYTFGASTAAPSSVTLNGIDYHEFTCPYTGAGAVSTAFDGTTNDAITIDSIINPAPDTGHTTGTADTHQIIIRHLDSGSSVVDETTVAVGVIEAVRVLATIPPQLTFQIIGTSSGSSACGLTTDVATTPTTVDFGDISISSFKTAAQTLTVSTNATNGYAVTALANDQMGRNGGACAGDPLSSADTDCIQDSRGDTSTMSHTVEDEFNSTATKGFAYSLHDSNGSISNGSAEAFSYDDTTGGCTGTFCARHFADEEGGQSAEEIFGSNQTADNENLQVCYRIIAPTEAESGFYENAVKYTATATF